MSLDYIRSYYGVPAKRNGKIVFDGAPCVIVGTQNQYLRVRRVNNGKVITIHPTWRVEYVDSWPHESLTNEASDEKEV